MLTNCIKNKTHNCFLPKRFVYKDQPKPSEVAPEAPAEAGKIRGSLKEKFDKNFIQIESMQAQDIGNDIKETAANILKFLKEEDRTEATKKQIETTLREGLQEYINEQTKTIPTYKNVTPDALLKFWKGQGKAMKIAKKDNEYKYRFFGGQGGEIMIKPKGYTTATEAPKKPGEATEAPLKLQSNQTLIEKDGTSLADVLKKIHNGKPNVGDTIQVYGFGNVDNVQEAAKKASDKGGSIKTYKKNIHITRLY